MSPGAERLKEFLTGRAVLLGIGNRWRGDDGAGPAVIDRVSGRVVGPCIDAGEAPERHLGEATVGAPEAIILIDAVDFGSAPGDIAVFGPEELPRRLGTTHDVPLKTLMQYLRATSGAEVALVGIQPGSTAFGEGLSAAVREAVEAVAGLLIVQLGGSRQGAVAVRAGGCAVDEEGGHNR